MLKRIVLGIITVFLTSVLFAQQAPKYSNEFLAIGVGARALGMSNAVIATTNDATAGFWNPAGLACNEAERQLALMHSEYFAGIAKYDMGAFSAKIDATSTVAATVIRFGIDDIPNTIDLIDSEGNINYDRITTFSAADYAFIFSYARNTSVKGLRFGVNTKVVHRIIGDFAKAWGFGFDVGLQYDYKRWHFGVVGKDVTSTFNAWSYSLSDRMQEVFTLTGNEIPSNSLEITLPKILLGAAHQFDVVKNITSLVELDADLTFDGKRNVLIKTSPMSIDPHIGVEFAYKNFIFLRGGVGNIQEESRMDGKKYTTLQPNMGLGIRIKNTISIDYALTDIGDNSIALYSNVFSLKVNFNKRKVSQTPAP